MTGRRWTGLVALVLVVMIPFVVPREAIVQALSVNRKASGKPDLIVVLGGGVRWNGMLGRSTMERLNAALVYTRRAAGVPILVAEYPAGRARMAQYLSAGGLAPERLVKHNFHYIESESGTVNNVRDVLSWVQAHPGVQTVVLITSPYHQRRVDMIWRQEAAAFGVQVLPRFLEIQNGGEIMTCSRVRFLKLIVHEFGGLLHRTVVR